MCAEVWFLLQVAEVWFLLQVAEVWFLLQVAEVWFLLQVAEVWFLLQAVLGFSDLPFEDKISGLRTSVEIYGNVRTRYSDADERADALGHEIFM